MTNIPKLDFYNTDAVKAFVLDVLVENQQLKKAASNADATSSMWFRDYQREKERAEKAETRIAELEKIADSLAAERDAVLDQKGGSDL